MDGVRSLFAARQPAVRLGYVVSSDGGVSTVAGLGTGASTDATPTGSSVPVASGSAAIIVCPSGNPQLWTAIGTGGWNLPPI